MVWMLTQYHLVKLGVIQNRKLPMPYKWYRQKYHRKGRYPFILWVWRLCEKTNYPRLSIRMQLTNLLCLSKTRALILFSMKLVNYLLTFFQPIWHSVSHSRYFAVILCQSLKWTPRVSPHKQATGCSCPFRHLWFPSWPLCGIYSYRPSRYVQSYWTAWYREWTHLIRSYWTREHKSHIW